MNDTISKKSQAVSTGELRSRLQFLCESERCELLLARFLEDVVRAELHNEELHLYLPWHYDSNDLIKVVFQKPFQNKIAKDVPDEFTKFYSHCNGVAFYHPGESYPSYQIASLDESGSFKFPNGWDTRFIEKGENRDVLFYLAAIGKRVDTIRCIGVYNAAQNWILIHPYQKSAAGKSAIAIVSGEQCNLGKNIVTDCTFGEFVLSQLASWIIGLESMDLFSLGGDEHYLLSGVNTRFQSYLVHTSSYIENHRLVKHLLTYDFFAVSNSIQSNIFAWLLKFIPEDKRKLAEELLSKTIRPETTNNLLSEVRDIFDSNPPWKKENFSEVEVIKSFLLKWDKHGNGASIGITYHTDGGSYDEAEGAYRSEDWIFNFGHIFDDYAGNRTTPSLYTVLGEDYGYVNEILNYIFLETLSGVLFHPMLSLLPSSEIIKWRFFEDLYESPLTFFKDATETPTPALAQKEIDRYIGARYRAIKRDIALYRDISNNDTEDEESISDEFDEFIKYLNKKMNLLVTSVKPENESLTRRYMLLIDEEIKKTVEVALTSTKRGKLAIEQIMISFLAQLFNAFLLAGKYEFADQVLEFLKYFGQNVGLASGKAIGEESGYEYQVRQNLAADLIHYIAVTQTIFKWRKLLKALIPGKVTDGRVAFNLACMSAVAEDRDTLFKYASLASELGYKKEQFLNDPDFAAFRDDEQFLALLKN